MEPFLTTLPPYVHEFLSKHPPTDVFNVLRDLICFAVLYSNDRERIVRMSKDLLEKGADGDQTRVLSLPKNVSTTPEPFTSSSEKPSPVSEPEKPTTEPTPVASASSSVKSGTDTPTRTIPWTFPEWWGHHDEPESLPAKKSDDKQVKAARRETVSTWVPWDEPTTSADKKMQRTMSVASSKPIPDLRPYLERSHTVGGSTKSPARRNTTTSPANTTPRPSKTPVSARASMTPTPVSARSSRTPTARASLPPASRATITPTTRATITPTTRTSKTPVTASPASASPPLSRTQSAFRPGQTATVRARQEHARAQQQQLEEQKVKAQQLNNVSLRLKQQAKSTIDWEAIKKERRRTMPIMKS
ncbi:hypothetical protein BJV82DRAFT_662538 [Fennellomyces sp. T-0311]|nr:hypothetical protein BJV82DRAFT_662538 [Fennellomyces sp. T-0311]